MLNPGLLKTKGKIHALLVLYEQVRHLHPFWAKLPYGYIHFRRPLWHVSGSEGLTNNTLSPPPPRVFPLHCREAYFLLAMLLIKNKWNCLSRAQLRFNRSTTTVRHDYWKKCRQKKLYLPRIGLLCRGRIKYSFHLYIAFEIARYSIPFSLYCKQQSWIG